jgi:hypothetical protein
MAARLADLAAKRTELDQAATDLGRRLGEQFAQVIGQVLDQPATGRLPEAMILATAAEEWLKQALASNSAAGAERWSALQAIEQDLEAVARQMDGRIAAGCFPQPTWRALAAMFLRPGRLWRLAQAVPEVQRLAAAYAALLLRQTGAALDVLKRDLAATAYEAAHEAVDRQIARLEAISRSSAAAMHRLAPIPPAPCGALGFGLELSALTLPKTEALYRQARGPVEDLLIDVAASPNRLSGWFNADPDGEDMAGVCLALARQRCTAALEELSIDQLVVEALPDARSRLEALAGLVESAGPFLAWDETRLHSLENDVLYSCAVLGVGEGVASPVLADTGEVLFAQVASTGDSRRVVALCAVHGLPLEALMAWNDDVSAHEYSALPDENL